MNKLISVIIPVYNVKEYLIQCVESVIHQSYNDLEILLIDDGSTDGSGELCDKIQALDERISVFHKVNGGLSSARNYGMKRSNGDFFAFIDSDDIIHENFFLVLMEEQEKSGAEIVACDLLKFQNPSEIEHITVFSEKTTSWTKENALKEYFYPQGQRKIHHGLCMKIYKKELFADLEFAEGRLHEDLYITYRLIDKSNKLVYIDAPYYFYFQGNSNSICKNYRKKNLTDEIEAYFTIWQYFDERGRISDEILHFLTVQIRYALCKGRHIHKDSEVKDIWGKAIQWIDGNSEKCAYFGKRKALIIRASVRIINIYSVLKKIK